MKMSFFISIASDPVPRAQATGGSATHAWHLGGGVGGFWLWAPLDQALPIGGVSSPPPTPAVRVGDASLGVHSPERLEARLVLPGHHILFNTVCAYQRTVSIHFGG